MDIPNIQTVVQWKATCDMCTLWQRFGHCSRGVGMRGTAVLLVEKKDMAEERQTKALRAAKRKAGKEGGGRGDSQRKRPALVDRNLMITDAPDLEIDTPDKVIVVPPDSLPPPVSAPPGMKWFRFSVSNARYLLSIFRYYIRKFRRIGWSVLQG